MKPHKIIISGGGTGGHLFPALAIAEEFQNRFSDAEILFVGALGRIEMTKVPNAGYKIIGETGGWEKGKGWTTRPGREWQPVTGQLKFKWEKK